MTLYKYLLSIGFSTAVSWAAWVIVLTRVDPFVSGFFGHIIFYVSLWFAMTGSLAIVGFVLRRWWQRHGDIVEQVVAAFRQGFLLSVLLVVSLVLQGARILEWWNILMFIAALALLEFFFVSRRREV